MSLIPKVPLLLSAGYFCQVGSTAPNPPAPQAAQKKFDGYLQIGSLVVTRLLTNIAKVIIWGPCICESALILAHDFPGSPFSAPILSALARFSSPTDVARLSMTPSFIAGWILVTSGTLLRLRCYRELGRWFTFELAVQKDQQLVTTGPYAVVRHPSYTGMFAMAAGCGLLFMTRGSWMTECLGLWTTPAGRMGATVWFSLCGFFCVRVLSKVILEDKVLRKEFGARWDEWAARTRYRLIPWIY